MPAYIIVEIEILDPVGYEEYKNLAGATVEKYGGKYIVRGGKTEVLEGDWQPKRIVVLEFESAQRAKEWLNCEEYREPRKMRHRTARTNMILRGYVATRASQKRNIAPAQDCRRLCQTPISDPKMRQLT